MTFRTSLDVRFPITIRSRGNWSVLYVRTVCVTTLPKCLVHMVRSLEDKKKISNSPFLAFPPNTMNSFFRIFFGGRIWNNTKPYYKHVPYTNTYTHIFTINGNGTLFSDSSRKKIHTPHCIKDFKTHSALSYSIRAICYLNRKRRWISIPHQTPRIDRAREDFLFHYKDRTS